MIFLFIIIGISFSIAFVAYKITKRYHPSIAFPVGIFIFIVPYLIAIGIFVIGLNPFTATNHLYDDDEIFENITAVDLPSNATLLFKETTTSILGKKETSIAFLFSEADFKSTLKSIRSTSKLDEHLELNSSSYLNIREQTENKNYLYYASSKTDVSYNFIGFCEDRKTVIIHKIIW